MVRAKLSSAAMGLFTVLGAGVRCSTDVSFPGYDCKLLGSRRTLFSPERCSNILALRGGAKKRGEGRTATIYSPSKLKKTATGRRKVGATSSEKGKKSALKDTMEKYQKILPLTRLYITMVGVCTMMAIILGDEMSQALLALDPIRLMYGFELWRPFSAAVFLGAPSVGWLMSGYYLFEYGSNLERAYGTAQHVVFLLTQISLLTFLSVLFGLPFFGQSVITSMLHVLSRTMPNERVKWLIFTVPYWSLPLGLMATDVLQAQSPMAALPHVLGILSGHFYFFHKFVWPKLGGEDWLVAPDFLRSMLDSNARANRSDKKESKLARKRGRGRKLGRP